MTAGIPQIDFYFDFISPFSYFAWVRLRRRELEGVIELNPRPVVFGALLDHWGHKGPAEIPPKRAFTWKTCLRFAAREGIPFQFPKLHPFNPLVPLRVALPEVSGKDQKAIIDAIFRTGWQDGKDLGSPEVVERALTAAGFDGRALVAKTNHPDTKDLLRRTTENAVKRGVFGVPTMAVGDELFWGNDQVETLEAFLDGDDVLDHSQLDAALARPSGVQRKAIVAKEPLSPVERIFHEAPFINDLGIALTAYGEGWCESAMRLGQRFMQQDGFGHAGVLATLADHTAGTAAGTVMTPGQRVLSIEFKINLLRPAVGDSLRCRATVLRAGKSVSVAEAEVFARKDGAEKLVAKAMVTLAVVPEGKTTPAST